MKPLVVCEPPLLGTASIVTRYCFPETCGELPHLTAQLDAFLNHFSGIWTIVTAYEHTKSLHWVKHFAAREPAEAQDQFYRRWLLNRTAELAAWNGDLETIQWLMEKYLPEEQVEFVASAAAARGHLNVLLWLHEHHRERVCFGGLEMTEALRNDHEHIVKWLQENGHVDGRAHKFSVFSAAANAGNLDVVKWVDNDGETQYKLYGKLPPACFSPPRRNALAVLKYLASRDLGIIKPEMLLAAAATGNLEVVKWLHFKQGLVLTVGAMKEATANGHFDLIKWMSKTVPGIIGKSVVESAAKYGSLEIIQWLHENWSGDAGVGVMDTAARHGHLGLVKWLHYHTEGCSESAMDGAAMNGHLEVVKWLHEHRSEGCRVGSMRTEAKVAQRKQWTKQPEAAISKS
ncbi:hypothetical protein V7S43_014402 [Phytophthora oleae]|uniref:Ankyrin repeat-containing domain n=1 Tax=Phytophthora oleae TaxID=2107226 RepID=A0ABD3F6F1_9STRA